MTGDALVFCGAGDICSQRHAGSGFLHVEDPVVHRGEAGITLAQAVHQVVDGGVHRISGQEAVQAVDDFIDVAHPIPVAVEGGVQFGGVIKRKMEAVGLQVGELVCPAHLQGVCGIVHVHAIAGILEFHAVRDAVVIRVVGVVGVRAVFVSGIRDAVPIFVCRKPGVGGAVEDALVVIDDVGDLGVHGFVGPGGPGEVGVVPRVVSIGVDGVGNAVLVPVRRVEGGAGRMVKHGHGVQITEAMGVCGGRPGEVAGGEIRRPAFHGESRAPGPVEGVVQRIGLLAGLLKDVGQAVAIHVAKVAGGPHHAATLHCHRRHAAQSSGVGVGNAPVGAWFPGHQLAVHI